MTVAKSVFLGVLWMLACSTGPAEPEPILVPPTPGEPAPSGPCGDDCLLLLEHDYRKLEQGGYCEICGPEVSDACDRTWPSETRLGCDDADYLRNCMYARLGYTFDKAPEWRQVFDKEAWYEPNEEFSWSDVTPVQSKNATRLKKMVENRACSD